ncbi:hypothetical protein B0I37DRAFT_388966 [Chaetomium sp. MPI-CAGE-AT-0009]|nr:hypothetical protein B0I37DRAFT_388966 [Chaetomium sp. MPI-CAGE-AT-0009]
MARDASGSRLMGCTQRFHAVFELGGLLIPTTRRSKRACADTNGDTVDPLSSSVEAAVRRPSTTRKAVKRPPPTKKAVPTKKTTPIKKTPRIVIRNTTEIPSKIPESEYNVEEELPARFRINGVIINPFNGNDNINDNIDNDIRPPSPPPLPKSIFYISTFKTLPLVPSRYLQITEPFNRFDLERTAKPSYITLARLEGLVAYTTCEVRLSKVAGLQARGTEFELTLEFEFELEPPVNNDDLVVAASPTPIRGFSTLVLPTSQPSGSRSGRAGAPLPRGVSTTPISNRGTPKAPSTRKLISNTIAEEIYQRYEADIAKSRTNRVVTTYLVFDELHFRWKYNLGSKYKNFRNSATAIRDGKTTKDNPPAYAHHTIILTFHVNINNNSNNTGPNAPLGTIWGASNLSYTPPSTATIADPPLP